MKINEKVEVTFKDGYYVLQMFKESLCEETSSTKVTKCTPQYFATLTGLNMRLELEGYDYISEDKSEAIKLEFYMRNTKKG